MEKEKWEILIEEEIARCKEDDEGYYLVDAAGEKFYWSRKNE